MEVVSRPTALSRFWLKNYPSYVAADIDPDRYGNILELLEESFKKYADLPAFEHMGKILTYREIDQLSRDFAAYLQQELKLKKGDRVAVQMPNLLQFPVAMFGIIRAGLIVVNTNPLYTPREMKHQFNDAGVSAIIVLENFASQLQEILSETPIKHVIITSVGDLLGGVKGTIVNLVVKYVKKMVPAYSLPGAISFKSAMAKGKSLNYQKPTIANSEVAFLQYTGGTTGLSKGASLTHRNIIANMEQLFAWVGNYFEEGKEVIITALPLYHIFALTANCLAIFKCGGKNVLITNPRDMPVFLKELKKHQMTVFTGVNTLFVGLMNQPSFKEVDFSKLKLSLGGGMAVQDAAAIRWKEVTGCNLVEAYGLSETSPGLVANPIDGNHRMGYIGLPLPSTLIMIADDEGNEVPLGERGEIWAKGPQVMPGYWQQPTETANVFHDGWFKTGDIGVMDEDGFLKIVDRKKEMILVSGFNVYPNEVENAIALHPKVLEVGVIGVPDEKTTEAVKAFVVKKDESLTEEELIAFCKENITAYKCPKHVEFRKELPKSNVGKILRRLLKEGQPA
ncbi:MAG: AMP-binding protein [Chitinophagales bacterium]|nr:AMP-binding protein [Chitinophagales bacterium]